MDSTDSAADFNDFTPSEWLLMEVLAARSRLGEALWTFPTYTKPTAKKLEERGFVDWKSGIIERTILVWFTDAGRELWLGSDYRAPTSSTSADIPVTSEPSRIRTAAARTPVAGWATTSLIALAAGWLVTARAHHRHSRARR